jgi:minor histocompatibility antigen H13
MATTAPTVTTEPSSTSTSSSSASAESNATKTTRQNYGLVASYVIIFVLWGASQVVLIPYVIHLLLLVTAILYAACHASLILLDTTTTTKSNSDGTGSDNNDGTTKTEPTVERETLKASDAYQFPLVGSASLFGLYCAFKFLGKEWVNLLIGAYFGLIGTVAVAMTLAPVLVAMTPKRYFGPLVADLTWHHSLHHAFGNHWLATKLGFGPESSPLEWEIVFNLMEVLAGVTSISLIGLYYAWEKPWYLNNLLGISFCLQGIERFSLGTYKIGAILLVGLFFYDIFWVFGTDVMVTVAKNLDGPIKILLPRTLEADAVTGKLKDLSLLGLGDIVIPGFFLALLLRFDAHRAAAAAAAGSEQKGGAAAAPTKTQSLHKSINIHDAFAKPYFHAALAAYVAGLGLTLFIMMRFNAAQPALLYLVPACLGSSFITALVRGEVKQLLDYSEEVEEETETDANNPAETSGETPAETKKDK